MQSLSVTFSLLNLLDLCIVLYLITRKQPSELGDSKQELFEPTFRAADWAPSII